MLTSLIVILSPGMKKRPTTQQVIRDYLIREKDAGRLSPPKFAEKIGVGPTMISMILRKHRQFPMDRLDAAAEFFRMPPDQFVSLVWFEIHPKESQRSGTANSSSGVSGAAGGLQPRTKKHA